ncbi:MULTISPECIES: VOC family protein [Brevibacillus]
MFLDVVQSFIQLLQQIHENDLPHHHRIADAKRSHPTFRARLCRLASAGIPNKHTIPHRKGLLPMTASPLHAEIGGIFVAVRDIDAAYRFLEELGVELTSPIQHGHWFTFKDPDGNALMAAKC